MKKIILKGTPPSTNDIYKYRRAGNFIMGYMTTKGKAKKEEIQWEMKSQWKKEVLKNDIEIDITFYFPDKRRRDWDNFNKIIHDAGTGIIWLDDSQIQDAHVHKKIDKDNSRVELLIY